MGMALELSEMHAEGAPTEGESGGLGRYYRTLAQVQECEAAVKIFRECESRGIPFEGANQRIFDAHVEKAAGLIGSRAYETPEGMHDYETR